jgi:threonine synthase
VSNATWWQQCRECGVRLDGDDVAASCPSCGGLLEVVHPDPDRHGTALRTTFEEAWRRESPGTGSGVWRYRRIVLPLADTEIVSHPEGNTPLLHRDPLDAWAGLNGLLIKHEGHNPTGSFKDRGMTVAVSQAKRTGARAVACASTGNTAASLAAYAAQAGLPALALVPDGRIAEGKLVQMMAYGAHTLLIDGDFDTCLALADAAARTLGVQLLNSINPFRIEGQKTIVLELLQQLHWVAPDWIVVPAGNLGNTAAFGKALQEALRWGLIDRLPRLAAVQAAGAAPFAAAFARGFDRLVPVAADTIASAIRIGAPASYPRAVEAIRATQGEVLAVSDAEILEAKTAVDRSGIGCEPASAAAIAGARMLRSRGVIGSDQRVVAVLTGHLLKDPATLAAIHRDQGSLAPGGANPPLHVPASLDAVRQAIDTCIS